MKACFEAFRNGKLDHHGEFLNLDFMTPQWSAGPIDAPDPKVDIAAVNPWMLRMSGEVADGVRSIRSASGATSHVMSCRMWRGSGEVGALTFRHRGDRSGDDDRR